MSNPLIDALVNMQETRSIELARGMLDAGTDPAQVLAHVRVAMDEVGKRFEEGEYFLPELILSGEIVREITDILKPALAGTMARERCGKVVIGTVQGDIHDLGKGIVAFMLEISGLDVVDLGVDVPPDSFVRAVREQQPDVVGLSGLLTLAYDAMRRTVDAIKAANLFDGVKVMIGGGHVTDEVRAYTGAHAFGKDAIAAVRLANGWVRGR